MGSGREITYHPVGHKDPTMRVVEHTVPGTSWHTNWNFQRRRMGRLYQWKQEFKTMRERSYKGNGMHGYC